MIVCLLGLSAQGETLKSTHYRLRIAKEAKILERVETGWETLMTVVYQGERVRVRWGQTGVSAIFANGLLRLQQKDGAQANSYELTVDFEGQRSKIIRTPQEVAWNLPGQQVFYRLFGGHIASAVGTSDYLKLTRDSRGGRLQVESQAGSSDFLLRKGTLEVFEGPELAAHTYFVRGLIFHRGPLTLEIPLPTDTFFKALPAHQWLHINSRLAPATKEATSPSIPPLDNLTAPTSLNADPPAWDSPMLNSVPSDPKDDPLRVRREPPRDLRHDPLKATTAPNSEEILRVKDSSNDPDAP